MHIPTQKFLKYPPPPGGKPLYGEKTVHSLHNIHTTTHSSIGHRLWICFSRVMCLSHWIKVKSNPIHGSKNEAYNLDVLVLLRFVSFPELKNEAYTCVLSLFRRAFAPFHSFTVLVSTRGFKHASPSRIKADTRGILLQGHAPGANFLSMYQRFHGYTSSSGAEFRPRKMLHDI